MTLLTIASALATNTGMKVPSAVISNPAREWVEAAQFANEAGEELARRVDWGQLQASATLTGDGTNLAHAMPFGFARLNRGVAVMAGTSIVRPLTRQEWSRLAPMQGIPRYFLLEGETLTLWPYLANGATVTVQYQSLNWCDNGTDAFASDTDAPLIDEPLFAKALIVRWRKQKGMNFQEEEAEFEAALQDFARANDRSRI